MTTRYTLLLIIIAAVLSACCTDNRKSKEAALQTALIIEAESNYVIDHDLIDPVALATGADGSFDKEACIEHAKMRELFKQDNFILAAALRAWGEDKDVEAPKPAEVDFEAICTK